MLSIAPVTKRILLVLVGVAIAAAGWLAIQRGSDDGPGEGFASGNGRIEATEIDISTRLSGRIGQIRVQEGDRVSAGQTLVTMQIDTLLAQRQEAEASHQEALQAVAAAQAQIALRESDVATARAVVVQREAELTAAQRRRGRSQTLSQQGAASQQELDDDQARARSAEASLMAAQAQVSSAQAAVHAARAQEIGARARVGAAKATIDRILADIADSELKSPRDGRIQLQLAQPGEVLAAGGRVLNLIDLADVTMTFFLPETLAGRIALGSDVRIILDVAPAYVIPARVSFVASTAQFTPKTVETASERQKLMFRIKARLPPDLLRKHLDQVKTGLPGVAWVKTDPARDWPPSLAVRLPD